MRAFLFLNSLCGHRFAKIFYHSCITKHYLWCDCY